MTIKTALTIAGSDPYSGGGLQTDLLTFQNYGIFGLSATTSIVSFNDDKFVINKLESKLLEKQIESLYKVNLDVIKIGLLANVENIKIVKDFITFQLLNTPVIFDPILAFKEGKIHLDDKYLQALIDDLLPLSSVITPNIKEAETLSGISIDSIEDMQLAAKKIGDYGVANVVIKGKADDVLYLDKKFQVVSAELIDTNTINGAGDVFSSAIASNLALGKNTFEAIDEAKKFTTKSIENGIVLNQQFGSVWPKNDN